MLNPPPRDLRKQALPVVTVRADVFFRVSRYGSGEPFFGRARANRFDALAMAGDTGQQSLLRPAAVAVHDDRHVTRTHAALGKRAGGTRLAASDGRWLNHLAAACKTHGRR